MAYWLLKSEPNVYSIDDLRHDGFTCWDGVRNYQARNFMRDQMKIGDLALFYHSNAKPPGIAGVCRVIQTGLVDPSAFDTHSTYYDSKSKPEKPRWITVEVEFVEKFHHLVTLNELKKYPVFSTLPLVQRGSRLSIMPIHEEQFHFIRELGSRL